MLKHLTRKGAFCVFVIAIAQVSYAQTDTLRLNFQDAEKAFLQNNLQLLAQKYNIDASKAQIEQAKLWDNPVLSTDQNIHDSGSNKFFYHNAAAGLGQVYVQLSQVFLTAGKRGKQVQIAKDDAQVQ